MDKAVSGEDIAATARKFVGTRHSRFDGGIKLIEQVAKEFGCSLELPEIVGKNAAAVTSTLEGMGFSLTFQARPKASEEELRRQYAQTGVGSLVTYYNAEGQALAPKVGEVMMFAGFEKNGGRFVDRGFGGCHD